MILISVQQRQAVEARALHPDVEENQPGHPIGDGRQRAVAVIRGAGFVALVAQDAGDKFANVFFVVDDENIRTPLPTFSVSFFG